MSLHTAVEDIKKGINNKDIKCVVWDLDNTIWDGVLTESCNVTLKPGMKEIIAQLDSRGILNSVASKNNHDDAVRKLNELGLLEYFLYPEINWNAKSSSISKIQKNLNIAIDTFMFIDDQPFELDEVKAVHHDIECFDASEYQKLLSLDRLNPRFVTVDSKMRRKMYSDDIKRKEVEESFEGTPEAFLASLSMHFIIENAAEEDLKRAEELTYRTHQLNSTGVTYDYDDLKGFLSSHSHRLYICELNDCYGSYGKIGLALVEIKEAHWHLKLILMSCRVISRGVGTVLLSYIMREAKKDGKRLVADFKKNDRNKQMYVAYKFANFNVKEDDGNGNLVLENDLSFIQEFPPYIKLEIK
ncbi:HAD-IIIC family phosphatase [Anaerobacterium chartisolvens]|nr:HAD-IIIC family phosphatase [Anaerobacterium chartisolvens]